MAQYFKPDALSFSKPNRMDRPHPRALQTPFHQTESAHYRGNSSSLFSQSAASSAPILALRQLTLSCPVSASRLTRSWQIILVHKLQTVNLKPRSRIESNTNGTERPIRRFLITDSISRNAMYYGAVPFSTLRPQTVG